MGSPWRVLQGHQEHPNGRFGDGARRQPSPATLPTVGAKDSGKRGHNLSRLQRRRWPSYEQ